VIAAVLAAAVACGVLYGLAFWAGAAGRRRRRAEQHAAREAVIRTALYRALDDPEPASIIDDLDAPGRRLLEAKARALLPALRGEDRETLGRLLESRGVTDAARRQCHSHRARQRVAACQLLGDVGSSFAVLDLVPVLDDPRLAVRTAAAKALGRLGQPTGVAPLMGAVASRKRVPVDVAADAIQQICDWPVSVLEPCLSDPSDRTRALAVELLGRFQATGCVGALVEVLQQDPAPGVRVRAARALGRIGSPRAVPALLHSVHSGSAALRAEAVSALGRLGAVTAVPTLRVALLGPSLRVSGAAAMALHGIGPQGIEVLREIADDDRHPAADLARRTLAAGQARAAGPRPEPTPLGV
jgi:HEAT repeat protein